MSKFIVSLTVTWSATGDVEIEADSEIAARYKAVADHDGISRSDSEEEDVEIISIKRLDEPDDIPAEEPPDRWMKRMGAPTLF